MTGVIQYCLTINCFIANVARKIFIGLSLLFFLSFKHDAPILADQVQKSSRVGTVAPIKAVYLKPINEKFKRVNIFIIVTL